ncbi:MAG: M48 family metalloprotease [Actinomycetota bacterium]|nr:M48 family metalloprotease [Actinomycetota bacterium]
MASRRLLVLRNALKAWLLLAGFALLLGFAGWQLGGYRLALLFLGSAVLLAGALYGYADRIVMGMVGARELFQGEAPALHSTIERLSARAGVVKPKLYVLPDGYPRALSAGRGAGGGAALALSVGLMGVASPAELEGIVAHELAHLRHRDVLVQTVAVVIGAAIVEASRLGGLLQRALLFVLGPLAAAVVHLLLSPKREYYADRFAAEVCNSPHGLADALIRLEQAMQLVAFEASPATEPLYTTNPFADEGLAALFASHPPIGERVRRLRELDPGWREKLRAA